MVTDRIRMLQVIWHFVRKTEVLDVSLLDLKVLNNMKHTSFLFLVKKFFLICHNVSLKQLATEPFQISPSMHVINLSINL